MKKLTIGSAVYDDFEGVYFSYQSIRLNNQDILGDLDLLIIDNNPDSEEGKATKHFCEVASIRYIPYTEKASTAVRNEIFNNSEAKFTMSIDCHVLFEAETIKNLINFFEDKPHTEDLYHGPMVYDQIINHDPVIQMDPVWRDHMFGIWKCGKLESDKPFEIPMHGLGIFACKTKAWPGFSDKFSGFGGEEGYIHDKFRQAGHKIWCLPFLKWVHRFQRPRGIQYKLDIRDRIRNYFVGFIELGKDPQEIIDHFNEEAPDIDCHQLLKEARGDNGSSPTPPTPPNTFSPSIPSSLAKSSQTSSIKFNSALQVKYLKIEFFSDCTLHAVKVLPSSLRGKEFKSTLLSCSSSGIKNPEGPWGTPSSPCTVSVADVFKEITLEYNKVMYPSCINICHEPKAHIMVYVSPDGEGWIMISEINI